MVMSRAETVFCIVTLIPYYSLISANIRCPRAMPLR